MDESRRSLFQRTRAVGLLTLLSRVLGLIRDVVMARQFGNGVIMDAFTVAFRVPNLARQLFGEGALSTAFLPVFLRDISQHGKQTAYRTATAVLMATAMSLLVLVIVAEIVVLGVKWGVEPGGEGDLLLGLIACLTPYLMLVCVLAQVCAVMQGLGRFTAPALFPVLLNILWIGAALGIGLSGAPASDQIHQISWAIVAIGVVQVVISLVTLKQLGFQYAWDWQSGRERVREISRVMLPVLVGLSITQLNTLCDSLIAWGLTAPANGEAGWLTSYPLQEGTTAALYLGQRMYQFPLGVFGAALGTVIFPLLATHASQNRMDDFRDDLVRGLRMVVAIGLPASVGLAVIAKPLTFVLFEGGAFDNKDASETSFVVLMYAFGVFGACGLLILNRAFYALGDRRTPLKLGMFAVGLNLALNFTLVWWWKGGGLALATAITATTQFAIAAVRIGRTLDMALLQRVLPLFLRVFLTTLAMLGVCLVLRVGLKSTAATPLGLFAIISIGASTYLVGAQIFQIREPFHLLSRSQKCEASDTTSGSDDRGAAADETESKDEPDGANEE